jgi:hypothetical protein
MSTDTLICPWSKSILQLAGGNFVDRALFLARGEPHQILAGVVHVSF